MKLGIFGGTFNPIHYGHLRAAEEAREEVGLDKILFIPAGCPPIKTEDIADASHRAEMVRLALSDNPHFEISDIECRQAGKSYSLNTLEELKTMHPDDEFFFILGIDAFLDLPNWWMPEILITVTNFIIISRPGFRFADLKASPYLSADEPSLADLDGSRAETYRANLKGGKGVILLNLTHIGISSTEIRRRRKQARSIKYLLPPEVLSYIIMNDLYRG